MKKSLFLVLVCVMVSILSGCVSNGFLMAKPLVSVFDTAYPAKAENTAIDVYFTSMPAQEYIEFALITCADTRNDWNMDQILKEARKIGADAIILTDIAEYWNQRAISVIAIKYKTPNLIAGIDH
jgi:hypothetical protein